MIHSFWASKLKRLWLDFATQKLINIRSSCSDRQRSNIILRDKYMSGIIGHRPCPKTWGYFSHYFSDETKWLFRTFPIWCIFFFFSALQQTMTICWPTKRCQFLQSLFEHLYLRRFLFPNWRARLFWIRGCSAQLCSSASLGLIGHLSI